MKTEVQTYSEGVGSAQLWGYAPPLDLQALRAVHKAGDAGSTFDALVVAPGDIRHVLLTLSRMPRHPERALRLYVYDAMPEQLARHLLLLSVYYDPELSVARAAEIFLELHGNVLIPQKTAEYLDTKSRELVQLVTDGVGPLQDLVDLSHLKFKQRDELEKVLKRWRVSEHFDMQEAHDKRVRLYYEERYDFRRNLFDWHYSMRMVNWASVVHTLLYKRWRYSGVAYEFRDNKYNEPNRSCCSAAAGRYASDGKKLGYWGDIVQSPYLALGMASEAASLLEKKSMQHSKTCVDVAEFNMRAMMHESVSGKPLEMTTEVNDQFDARNRGQQVEEIVEDEVTDVRKPPPGCSVVLMQGPVAAVTSLRSKAHFRNRFDVVSIGVQGCSSSNCVAPGLSELLKDEAMVAMEGAKFLLDIRVGIAEAFDVKISDAAARAGLSRLQDGDKLITSSYHFSPLPSTAPKSEDGRRHPYLCFGYSRSREAEIRAAAPKEEAAASEEVLDDAAAKAGAAPDGVEPVAADQQSQVTEAADPIGDDVAVGGTKTPEHTLSHRHWTLRSGEKRPKELVLRTTVPGCGSAGSIDLDVQSEYVKLVCGVWHLELALPYPVQTDKGSARFDKDTCQLTVVMPVVPEEKPAVAKTATVPLDAQALTSQSSEGNSEVSGDQPDDQEEVETVQSPQDDDLAPWERSRQRSRIGGAAVL